MSNPRTPATLQETVRDYYEDHAIDEAALGRLMSARPRRSPSWLWAAGGALAATLILGTVGLGLGWNAWLPQTASTEVSPAVPRLVAVQIRADWCPRTPEVGPVFAKLVTRYGSEPLLFVTLDITDDARREQAELLSANLGIPQALEQPFGSGIIKLIDREDHRVLAAVTRPEQLDEIESRIAEALHVTDRDEQTGHGGGA